MWVLSCPEILATAFWGRGHKIFVQRLLAPSVLQHASAKFAVFRARPLRAMRSMRWQFWATAVAAYAAEIRLETFVTVELTLDNLPLTLRAHVDVDPGKAAELFCKDAIPLSLECKDRFAAALRAEQAAVRIRTGRVKPPEPRKQVPAPPKLVWLSEPMARAPSDYVALSIVVGGRRLHVEAGVDEPPHAAVVRLCREQDVKPRDCNVVALALAEKQKRKKRDGNECSDEYAAFLARMRMMESREASWGDHFSGGVYDVAR